LNVLRDHHNEIQRLVLQQVETASTSDIAEATRRIAPLLSNRELVDLVASIQAELTGIGPLEDLLLIDGVTDILVNRFDDVWVDCATGLRKVEISWDNEETLRTFAARLTNSVGRRLDDLNPCVDLKLGSGMRCHIAIPPVSIGGTALSIRVPQLLGTPVAQLLAHQPTLVTDLMTAIVASRQSFLISGSTGSGKTTLLSALLGQVSRHERVVIIEDTQEIAVTHPHVVSLQARQANIEGVGAVGLRQLVRETLRMRPDRIILGEVRGPEIVDLFTALNTGHQGGASTVHANSSRDVIARVEALGMLSGISRPAVHSQFASAIDVVIHVAKSSDGRRAVREISMTTRDSNGLVELIPCAVIDDEVNKCEGWDTLVSRIQLGS